MFLNLIKKTKISAVGVDLSEANRATVQAKVEEGERERERDGGAVSVRIGDSAELASVLSETSTLVTMLPNGAAVTSVVEQALAAWREREGEAGAEGRLIVDCSTIDPATVRTLGAAAADDGHSLVDAPVSGGVNGAAQGTLTFMVGADPADNPALYDRVSTLLQPMAGNIVACGGAGNGQVAKLANNLVLACSMIGVSEAFALASSLGLSPSLLHPILSTSTARCWSVDSYCPVPGVMEGVPAERDYEGGFGVSLMLKDLTLANRAAASGGVPLPLGGSALQTYSLMEKIGLGTKDFGVVHRVLSGGERKKE